MQAHRDLNASGSSFNESRKVSQHRFPTKKAPETALERAVRMRSCARRRDGRKGVPVAHPAPTSVGVRGHPLRRRRRSGPSSRALKLYELFLAYPSLDAIPADVRQRLEKTVFRKPIDTVWQETVDFTLIQLKDPEKIKRAESDPKGKMALIFRWYLGLSSGWANAGVTDRAMDFQVWCGPAIGSFNDFVRGTYLDPAVANAYHDVHEANMQLLRGACVLRRIQQLEQHLFPPTGMEPVAPPSHQGLAGHKGHSPHHRVEMAAANHTEWHRPAQCNQVREREGEGG